MTAGASGDVRALLRTALLGLALMAAVPAAAASHRWESYANARFGYAICYPADLLRPQGEADNSDGQKFLADDGAELIVYGSNNVLSQSVEEVSGEIARRLAGAGGRVTYKSVKPSRFVVSGLDASGRVFYAALRARKGQFATFELTYTKAEAATYDKVAARLGACFTNPR